MQNLYIEDENYILSSNNSVNNEEEPAGNIVSLRRELTRLWDIYNIEPYYREIFEKSISDMQAKESKLRICKEVSDFLSEAATIQKLNSSIQKREKYLIELSYLTKELAMNWSGVLSKDLIIKVTRLMEEIRNSTLLAIENGLKLRTEYKIMQVMYKGEDYFQKIVDDDDMIKSSDMSKFFNFSKSFDPFFFTASQPQKLPQMTIGNLLNENQ